MGDLESTLKRLGYRWFELDEKIDLAELLISILGSKNLRFIKAIPFIIYQTKISRKEQLDWARIHQLSLQKKLEKEIIFLIYLSSKIFHKEKLFSLEQELETYINGNLGLNERKLLIKNPDAYLTHINFRIPHFHAFLDEAYRDFLTSLKLAAWEKKEYIQEEIAKTKEINLKFALSVLFKKKQREIIQKILAQQALNKTEYEYYIRIIKKRLDALIQLSELAQSVLQKKIVRE